MAVPKPEELDELEPDDELDDELEEDELENEVVVEPDEVLDEIEVTMAELVGMDVTAPLELKVKVWS